MAFLFCFKELILSVSGFVCVSMFRSVYISAGAHVTQRHWKTLERELHRIVSCLIWVFVMKYFFNFIKMCYTVLLQNICLTMQRCIEIFYIAEVI